MSALVVNELLIDSMMNSDVFERFERTRGGLLIPVLLFVVGAVATVLAIKTVHGVAIEQLERSAPTGPVNGDSDAAVDLLPVDVANEPAAPQRGHTNL
jgi:hypothetical protein